MNDESNYSNGISPDYVIDEFDTSNYGLYWGELGTTDDIMINLIVQKFNGEEEEETRATSGRYSCEETNYVISEPDDFGDANCVECD